MGGAKLKYQVGPDLSIKVTRISQEAKQLYRIIGIKPPDQIQAIL